MMGCNYQIESGFMLITHIQQIQPDSNDGKNVKISIISELIQTLFD